VSTIGAEVADEIGAGPTSETETISQSREKAIVLDQESAAVGEMFGLLSGEYRAPTRRPRGYASERDRRAARSRATDVNSIARGLLRSIAGKKRRRTNAAADGWTKILRRL
jgi:hypothetical protein